MSQNEDYLVSRDDCFSSDADRLLAAAAQLFVAVPASPALSVHLESHVKTVHCGIWSVLQYTITHATVHNHKINTNADIAI